MRTLKIIAIVMSSLLIAMLLMLSYLFLTAEVTVKVISSQGVPADQQEAAFQAIQTGLAEDTFTGLPYQKPTQWKESSDYVFLTYMIQVNNGCLVPIDGIEVRVVPQPSDIVQLADFSNHGLNPKSSGNLSATILAPKDTHAIRELVISYYVWGVSFQIETLSSGS